jgi:hypothetical protein
MERGFNKSGFMVSPKRQNLKSETIRACQRIASWGEMGLIPEEKVIEHFANKQKKGKKPVQIGE